MLFKESLIFFFSFISYVHNCPANDNSFKADIEQFVGEWYRIAETKLGSISPVLRCGLVTYTKKSNNTLTVETTGIISGTSTPFNGIGEVTLENKSTYSADNAGTKLDVWVLDSDYKSYALIYSCALIGDNSGQIFIYSRSRRLSPDIINKLKDKASKVIKDLTFEENLQKGCSVI